MWSMLTSSFFWWPVVTACLGTLTALLAVALVCRGIFRTYLVNALYAMDQLTADSRARDARKLKLWSAAAERILTDVGDKLTDRLEPAGVYVSLWVTSGGELRASGGITLGRGERKPITMRCDRDLGWGDCLLQVPLSLPDSIRVISVRAGNMSLVGSQFRGAHAQCLHNVRAFEWPHGTDVEIMVERR